jgi:hypothetical protein
MKKISFFVLIIMLFSNINAKALGFTNNIPIITQKSSSYNSMKEFLNSWDLKMKNETDENIVSNYVISKNQEMIRYINAKYPKVGITQLDANDPDLVILGQVIMIAEENNFKGLPSQSAKMAPWLKCALDVVWGYLNIVDAYNEIVATFTSGASSSAVWAVIKKQIKRHLSWVGAIWAVGEIISDCF